MYAQVRACLYSCVCSRVSTRMHFGFILMLVRVWDCEDDRVPHAVNELAGGPAAPLAVPFCLHIPQLRSSQGIATIKRAEQLWVQILHSRLRAAPASAGTH